MVGTGLHSAWQENSEAITRGARSSTAWGGTGRGARFGSRLMLSRASCQTPAGSPVARASWSQPRFPANSTARRR